MIKEFDLIDKFFASLPYHREDVALGIGDDAALIRVPAGKLLVSCTDSFVENTHFFANAPAASIGYKSLAVNLSDIAAMGAIPCWVSLALTLPSVDEDWLANFTQGISSLLQKFNLQIIGGDTTRGPLSITVQILGTIESEKALCRKAAQPGDIIYVTGNLGDAACALEKLRNQQQPESELIHKLYYPTPRVFEGVAVSGIAHAGIDISDGLLADLNHILKKSQVGAVVFPEKLPLSSALLRNASAEEAKNYALTGGDEYELCLTVPPQKEKAFQIALDALQCPYTSIGSIEEKEGLYLETSTDRKLVTHISGYQHF